MGDWAVLKCGIFARARNQRFGNRPKLSTYDQRPRRRRPHRTGGRRGEALTTMDELVKTFDAWAEGMAVACFVADEDANLASANREWFALTGLSPQEALGAGWLSLVHDEDRERFVAGWKQAAERGQRFSMELRVPSPGGVRWFSCVAARHGSGDRSGPDDLPGSTDPPGSGDRSGSGEVAPLVGCLSEITSRVELEGSLERALMERVRATTRLRAQQAKLRQFRQVFDSSPLAISICDLQGRFLEVNDALCALAGLPRSELTGMHDHDLVPVEDRVEVDERGSDLDPWSPEGVTFEGTMTRADGVKRWLRTHAVVVDDDPEVEAFVVMLNTDITEQKVREARLHHDASHDSLTGIPNRALLFELVEQALARAVRQGANAALLFLDLDHFKAVNDRFGHGAGDRVLQESAQRLRDAVRVGDTVGRYGGDELAVLCENLAEPADAEIVARRICRHLAEDIILPEGYVTRVGASVGVALASGTESVAELFESADRALYEAKAKGRGRHVTAAGLAPLEASSLSDPARSHGRAGGPAPCRS